MRKIFVLFIATVIFLNTAPLSFSAPEPVTCWFPPAWKARRQEARSIVRSLSEKSGISIRTRIAKSYPEILSSFSSQSPSLTYVGSFAQAIIYSRDLGIPLVQCINGRELYSGIMIYPANQNPQVILRNHPEKIAFTKGASSGESSAKAATGGRAGVAVANHFAAVKAVKAGMAKAAFIKNWWWEDNAQKFEALAICRIPKISLDKNPDNVLTASKSLPAELIQKITDAAIDSKDVFGVRKVVPFDINRLHFSIELMKKAKIDPITYSWR